MIESIWMIDDSHSLQNCWERTTNKSTKNVSLHLIYDVSELHLSALSNRSVGNGDFHIHPSISHHFKKCTVETTRGRHGCGCSGWPDTRTLSTAAILWTRGMRTDSCEIVIASDKKYIDHRFWFYFRSLRCVWRVWWLTWEESSLRKTQIRFILFMN